MIRYFVVRGKKGTNVIVMKPLCWLAAEMGNPISENLSKKKIQKMSTHYSLKMFIYCYLESQKQEIA